MTTREPIVGILAFQGNVAEHRDVLTTLGARSNDVRSIDDLESVTHLIIPGGESTVMGRFLHMSGLDVDIQRRAKAGTLAVFGTCAGAILMAKSVTGKNAPKPLALIDMTIDRNAYGSQVDSFERDIAVLGIRSTVPVSFIRAPIIKSTGKSVDILATVGKDPVLVQQGRHLAATFHEEMRGQTAVHAMFLGL